MLSAAALALVTAFLRPPSASVQAAPLQESQVVEQAIQASPVVAAAQAAVRQAQAHEKEMRSHLGFQLDLQALVSESSGQVAQPVSNQSFGSAEADVIAPIPNKGRADSEIDGAQGELRAAEAQLRAARLDVAYQASQAFYNLLRAQDAKSITQENLDQSQRQLSDVEKRVDSGDVPQADLLKAQVPVAQNQAALAQAVAALSAADQVLDDLLHNGLDETPSLEQPTANANPQLPQPGAAVQFALAHSPDIAIAQADLETAKAAVRFAKHARDLDVSLQLSHARTADPTAYSFLTALTLSFALPILDGGAAHDQVLQAEAVQQQTEQALEAATRQVTLAVRQAILAVQADAANVQGTSKTEQIAKESLAKAKQSYQAGLTTTRDVLDAQLIYSQSRFASSSAVYDLKIAEAALKQALGGEMP